MEPIFIHAGAGAGGSADRIGSKAVNLARLARIGLRVPAAFVLDTDLTIQVQRNGGRLPDRARSDVRTAVARLERLTGRQFGGYPPLLVSVRSSPPVSMPGMLDTILNVGLTESTTRGLLRATGNPPFVWDTARRFACLFSETVAGAPTISAEGCSDGRDPLTLRDLARDAMRRARAVPTLPFPDDPYAQLEAAVEAVFRSWSGTRARDYRRLMDIHDDTGTAVIVQAMVFGNGRCPSGSGVGFTRNPSTGVDELFIDFAFNAQGEDVVAGRHRVDDSARLMTTLPAIARELADAKSVLEREFRDMQDFEFTVEAGVLHFLQTRSGKRTPWAALQIAVDLVRSHLIDPYEALRHLESYELEDLSRSRLQVNATSEPIAAAVPAGIGTATGAIALDCDRALELAKTRSVILVRRDLATTDLPGLAVADGVLTAHGGRTSHAAVVARQLGKVCLAGCSALLVDETRRRCSLGSHTFVEGDIITLDADSGRVYAGAIPTVIERPEEALEIVRQWRAAATPVSL
jgi:pyruvate,orthophosphate dikinase